jgi:hypothetical protein
VPEASHHPAPPTPLSTSGRRALAATMLGTATRVPPFACSLLVDGLDAASWSLLAVAGASPAEARAVLAALWTTDPNVGDAGVRA